MFFAIKSKRAVGTSTCYIIDQNYDSIEHNRHAGSRRNT